MVKVGVEVGVNVEVEVGGVRVGVGLTFSVVFYFLGGWGGVGRVVGKVRDKAISTQVVVEDEV